jgi:hypothetical protein
MLSMNDRQQKNDDKELYSIYTIELRERSTVAT